MMKNKIKKIINISYNELKKINPKIKKKNSIDIYLKGKNSELDSVDIVTFFSILDNNFKKNKLVINELLDDKFFFKYKNIKIKDLILYIYEQK